MPTLFDLLTDPAAGLILSRDPYGRRFVHLDSPLAAQDIGFTHAYEAWLDELESPDDDAVCRWMALEARYDAQEYAYVAARVSEWEHDHPALIDAMADINTRCQFTADDKRIARDYARRRGQVEVLAARLYQRGIR
jgi:hypothetical protein